MNCVTDTHVQGAKCHLDWEGPILTSSGDEGSAVISPDSLRLSLSDCIFDLAAIHKAFVSHISVLHLKDVVTSH